MGDVPETFIEKALLLESVFQSDVLFSFIPHHAFCSSVYSLTCKTNNWSLSLFVCSLMAELCLFFVCLFVFGCNKSKIFLIWCKDKIC